jgi:RNA polymerase sigma-70 factor (ECF subfamily)
MNDNGLQLELVSRASAGDRSAIQELLMLHHRQLVTIIEKQIPADLRGLLSADDVCQEAYVSVFRQIASFQPHDEQAFERWLRTIADRKLVDLIRTQRAVKRGSGKRVDALYPRNDTSSMIELLDVLAVHERTPSRSAAHRELVRIVQDALDGLKEDYREVLRLRYIQSLSVAETAQQMGRSDGAVMMLCNRGLQQLEEVIGDPSRFFSKGA